MEAKITKPLRKYLEEKGYEVSSRSQWLDVTKTSDQSSWYILIVFTLLSSLVIISAYKNNDVFWLMIGVLTAIVLLLVFFVLLYYSSQGKRGLSDLRIDGEDEYISFKFNGDSRYLLFSQVRGLNWDAVFVAEYTSAFKSTSQEFKLTFSLQTNEGSYELFETTSDYDEPTGLDKKWFDVLEKRLKLTSQTSKT